MPGVSKYSLEDMSSEEEIEQSTDNGLNDWLCEAEQDKECEVTDTDTSSGDEEELLRIEEANRQERKKENTTEGKEETEEKITALLRLCVALVKKGPTGTINPQEYEFTRVFSNGIDTALEQIQNSTRKVLEEFEQSLSSDRTWKRIGRNKPIKQRIKQSISEKTKRIPGPYEDMPFISALTKDYCYKKGIRLFERKTKTEKKRKSKPHKLPSYPEMQGFLQPLQSYEWEHDKIDEFMKCVLTPATYTSM